MGQTLNMNDKGLLFKLTWPIFIELVLQMLVGNVDQMMMSQCKYDYELCNDYV